MNHSLPFKDKKSRSLENCINNEGQFGLKYSIHLKNYNINCGESKIKINGKTLAKNEPFDFCIYVLHNVPDLRMGVCL